MWNRFHSLENLEALYYENIIDTIFIIVEEHDDQHILGRLPDIKKWEIY